MRLKAIHALQQLLCAGPCRLALIVAYRPRLRSRVSRCSSATWPHGFHRVAVLFRVFTVALRDEPSNLRRISPLLGTLCPVLGLWPLWCDMHGVSLGTLVSYPLHVGCRTLALPSVPPVVQGGMRTDSGLLHDACWIVEALSRTNPSTAFMRFSWLNPWALREISTPSSSSKLHSWITY
jgi:hypothetical protein